MNDTRLFLTGICGNGFALHDLEQCDDNNTVSGDGCSHNCTIEEGYNCSGGSALGPDTCYGSDIYYLVQ